MKIKLFGARTNMRDKIIEILRSHTTLHKIEVFPDPEWLVLKEDFASIADEILALFANSEQARLSVTELDELRKEVNELMEQERQSAGEPVKTSEEWQKLHPDLKIYDPDGWDRMNFKYSWYEEKITYKEYEQRLIASTIMPGEPNLGPQCYCEKCVGTNDMSFEEDVPEDCDCKCCKPELWYLDKDRGYTWFKKSTLMQRTGDEVI